MSTLAKGKDTHPLQDLPRQPRPERHKTDSATLGPRSPAPTIPPYRIAYSTEPTRKQRLASVSLMSRGRTTCSDPERRTSILPISILPYCLRSSLFACDMASSVTMVFRRFSVARAVLSMLKVCWVSCASCASYMRFCLRVRRARCWIASYIGVKSRQIPRQK
jgi:hypothetical protein